MAFDAEVREAGYAHPVALLRPKGEEQRPVPLEAGLLRHEQRRLFARARLREQGVCDVIPFRGGVGAGDKREHTKSPFSILFVRLLCLL